MSTPGLPWLLLLLLLLLSQGILQNCCEAYNVGLQGAKVFSGPSSEQFGYNVQQLLNEEGKWLLVGSPWSGYPRNRMGDVYKCALSQQGTKCSKMNLQTFASIPNVTEIKKDMNLGLTLVRNSVTGGFLTCGPLWAQQCGSQYYATGICSEFSPSLQLMRSFSPAVQKCSSAVDVVVVCDESNSIYPWDAVKAFLKKFVQGLDIGPTKTQVGLIQYGNNPREVFNLNTYTNKEDAVQAMSETYQNGGEYTNTFRAIEYARRYAFSKESGGRPSASKVMVVVTDGESHDGSKLQEVIAKCNEDNITRFGIAVLGYLIRNELDTKNLIKEIKGIASLPTSKYFFNVSSEAALLEEAGTLGERLFSIEGTDQGDLFQLEMSQVGFSASYSQQKEVLMLGAVGAYEWTGTVIQESEKQATVFPNDAFEKVLQDRNQSSYLGYSVAVLTMKNTVYFVAGAPRSNYTGRVVVYQVDGRGNISIIHSQRGEQIGSYFGSVICSVDVNGDSITDVLLVSAPMFMNDFKKEEGKVYMFAVKNGILDKREILEGPEGLENTRYGSAITAISDLDLDGFNDVIVGAPLENQNAGAIYIYNGKQRTIQTRYSQKISGSDPAFGKQLRYFGRSIDGRSDLNGDGITDVSVGSDGNVIQLWSQSIAKVSMHISSTPKKISLLNKNTEVILQICFTATFRPANGNNQVDIRYNLTLDADLLSSRVTSRGLFKENNERYLQDNIIVRPMENCVEHIFNVQEPSDAVDSLSVRVDIRLKNPGSSPVLDKTSPASVTYAIPFVKDCGGDEVCIADLVLDVQQKTNNGKQPVIINSKNKRLIFGVKLRNKKENAYNTRIQIVFSGNLFFASSSSPVDGTDVSCQMSTVQQFVVCQISYPVFKEAQQVSFDISFDFNLKSLQNLAVLSFQALSASNEEDDTNNQVNLTVPLRYDAELHLTRFTSMNFYEVYSDYNVPSMVNNFDEIGPAFNFSIKVTTGSIPVNMASLKIHIPKQTEEDNPLMYVTAVHASQDGDLSCEAQINPYNIGQQGYAVSFKKENFKTMKELNCKNVRCDTITCKLKDITLKAEYYVNVSARIWNGTFAASNFQRIQLTAFAEIDAHNSALFVTGENTLSIPVTIINPDEKAEVPIGVVIGSVLVGLLLLVALIAALWKLGFFKRKYEKMGKDVEDVDETLELTKD
uniref:Integrin alpha-2 n=1 Tax=Anolis carolinensis TaxID=28377 RepID=G1KCG9_ANOCA|nr:PREDICTED: integrin alpha-2 [Anolis carolinensis]|eukprot:XP_008101009.1 PREDICTED: integrin alpha-2 [Anolis carolinensis]